jgi:Zn-dependent M32 family carboxypeptidase
MNKAGKIKVGAGVAKARAETGKTTRNRQSAETKLAELKRSLLEISDLAAAGAVLRWDQSTYMPRGGAPARARQRATLSRLAHEKSVDAALGKLLDDLAPYAAGLPYDSDEASLIRVARRDFEKAIMVLRGPGQRARLGLL